MHGRSNDNGPERVARFWRNYLQLLAKSPISEHAMPWYRPHVGAFISAHGGRRLSDHDAMSVSAYRERPGRNPPPEAWRFLQAVDALRILFCVHLRVYQGIRDFDDASVGFEWRRPPPVQDAD